MRFLFEQKWQELGRQFDKNTFADVEAMNEIIKITHEISDLSIEYLTKCNGL